MEEKKCHRCGVTGGAMVGHGPIDGPTTWTCYQCSRHRFWVGVITDEKDDGFGPYERIRLVVSDSRKPLMEYFDLESVQIVIMEDGSRCLKYKMKKGGE